MAGDLEDDGPSNRFKISLRIFHPDADPGDFTRALNQEPRSAHKAGDARHTPAGRSLPGVWPDTYWMAAIELGSDSSRQTLDQSISSALRRLVEHRNLFDKVRTEGGRTELFIGWFFNHQSGDVLSYQTLSNAGDLKIDLSLDIYSPDQPQS